MRNRYAYYLLAIAYVFSSYICEITVTVTVVLSLYGLILKFGLGLPYMRSF